MTTPDCNGCGVVLASDLERATMEAVKRVVATSRLVAIHAEASRAEVEAARAEAAHERAGLEAERRTLEERLAEALALRAKGALASFPPEMVAVDTAALHQRLCDVDDRLRALASRLRTSDDLTAESLLEALEQVQAPFRQMAGSPVSDTFRYAFVRLIRSVTVSESDVAGFASARIAMDLGPLVGAGPTDDDPDRHVVETVLVPRVDTRPSRRGLRPDPTPAMDGWHGLSDAAWRAAEPCLGHVAPTVLAVGWDPRRLVDAAHFVAQLGWDVPRQARVGALGPLDTFPDAARALVLSGAHDAVAHALRGTEHEVANAAALVPGAPRPDVHAIAARVALSGPRDRPDGGAGLRREIVAMVGDGLRLADVARVVGYPVDAILELVSVHAVGGSSALDAFTAYDLNPVAKGTAAALAALARDARSPAVELRLIVGAETLKGASVGTVATLSGLTTKDCRLWASRLTEGGVARLWSKGWCLRPHKMTVGRAATRHAEALRALAADLPRRVRRPVEAVAAWCDGGAGERVLSVLGGEALDFERHVAAFRERGVDGMRSTAQQLGGGATPEGDAIRDSAARMRDADGEARMRLVAEFVDGRSVAEVAARFGLDVGQVRAVLSSWSETRAVSLGVTGASGCLGRDQLAHLGKVVAAGRDPHDPSKRVSWNALRRVCSERWGIDLDLRTVRTACLRGGVRLPRGSKDAEAAS